MYSLHRFLNQNRTSILGSVISYLIHLATLLKEGRDFLIIELNGI